MRCPFCRVPLHSAVAECPACRVTFPRSSALLGAIPKLVPQVSDVNRLLNTTELTKVKRAIKELGRKYPQLVAQVVMHPFARDYPFSLHAFWLFNAGAFSGDSHRGENNHTMLLVVDPTRQEAAIVVGYGLESLLPETALDHLLELAGPAWQAKRWAAGIFTVLEGFDRLCESVAAPESESRTPRDF